MTQTGRLQGRTCLIVGGPAESAWRPRGRFLEEGALVVVCGRSQKTVAEARAILEDVGRERVLALAADASDPAQVEGLFQQVLAFFSGRLDILFHVAGISGRRFGDAALHECTVEGWDTVLDANARSLFLTNRAAVRQMLAQPLDEHGLRGTVLNMGSVLGWSPAPDFFGTIAYAASKGAIRAMTLNAGGPLRAGPDPVQPDRPGSDRDPDGRPGRQRPGDPCLPGDQAADGRRAGDAPRTAPRRHSTCASRPRGSSPASS